MPTEDLDFAARCVQDRRAELGLRQADLARIAGIDVSTISTLERGEHLPRPATRARVEDALGWRRGSLRDALSGRVPVLAGDEQRQPPVRPEDLAAHLDSTPGMTADLRAALLTFTEGYLAARDGDDRLTGT